MTKKISESGLQFIASQESFSPVPYKDAGGVLTIGYGHVILPGQSYSRITEQQGLNLLNHDVGIAENAINTHVKVKLNQNQFNALVSFIFNIGAGAFDSSTLLRILNAGDYTGVPAQLKRWNHVRENGVEVVSSDLTTRRAMEARTWIQ